MFNSISTQNDNLNFSGEFRLPGLPQIQNTSQLNSLRLKSVEADISVGKYTSLIDILTIFISPIPLPSLSECPKIAFRYLELATKMSPPPIEDILYKVHRIFKRYHVYANACPEENVLITCPKGSILCNDIVLKISYPFFAEKLRTCNKSVLGPNEGKYEIEFDDIESIEALRNFREITYDPSNVTEITKNLDQVTRIHLYQLFSKISCTDLQLESAKVLEFDLSEDQPENLRVLAGLNDEDLKKIYWDKLIADLDKYEISYMKSANQEIALNVMALHLMEKQSAFSILLQAFTTGLYVDCETNLENLLSCGLTLKRETCEKIKNLIFPGFAGDYKLIAGYFPNISNIIIRTRHNVPYKSVPNCFSGLKLISWIREDSPLPSLENFEYIAEVKHCASNFWLQVQTVEQLKSSMPVEDFNKSFSWEIEKKGVKSGLFCKKGSLKLTSYMY